MGLIQSIIVLNFIITLIVGLRAGKKMDKTGESFYVAKRSLPTLVIALALFAQALDGNSSLGNTALAYDFGFWAGASLPIGLALSLFLLGGVFAKKLHGMRLLTLVDFFEQKYNRRIAVITALFMMISFGVLLAGNLAAVAILLQSFFPWHYNSIVIFLGLFVFLYSFRGGLLSDIHSDIFQIIVTVLGIGIAAAIMFTTVDWTLLWQAESTSQFLDLTQLIGVEQGALVNWATIFALGFGNILAIDFTSRILAAKSGAAAQRGAYLAAGITLIIGLLFSFLPAFMHVLGIAPQDNTPIILTFASATLPFLAYILLIGGLINSALSTIDGGILSMGNILVHNLLGIRKDLQQAELKESEATFLYFSRLGLVPITALAIIFAIALPTPGILLTVAFDIMFAALLIPFLVAFFGKQPDVKAALWAIIVGSAVRLLFAILTPTSFGVPNTIFYLANDWIPPTWDGLGTFLAPLTALLAYYGSVLIRQLKQKLISRPTTV